MDVFSMVARGSSFSLTRNTVFTYGFIVWFLGLVEEISWEKESREKISLSMDVGCGVHLFVSSINSVNNI